jgi:hypothetical protein
MDLDALAQLHANRANQADGYATSTHSGVAAVLQEVADEARLLAARSTEVYDNRLLFQLAAQLDKAARPVVSKRPTKAVN